MRDDLCALDSLAEYRLLRSRSGDATAVHLPSNNLIHSAVDPVREAIDIVSAGNHTIRDLCVVVGGGLGFVPEALLRSGAAKSVLVIEPDPALFQLGRHIRPDAEYYSSPAIRTAFATTSASLSWQLREIPKSAGLLIAPYLLRIACADGHPLANAMRIVRAEQTSRFVYDPIVAGHELVNRNALANLPSVFEGMPLDKPALVIGAGPSLDRCVDVIRESRQTCTIIAASGAVPALLKAGVVPDWTVALEAKDAVLADVAELPVNASVIVFPATHPNVLKNDKHKLWSASDSEGNVLSTRGGSSIIPALDFALRVSSREVILIGVDLGYQAGQYARGTIRDNKTAKAVGEVPPKFLSMRVGVERLIEDERGNGMVVYHVMDRGVLLKGTRHLLSDRLSEVLNRKVVTEVIHE
jgi:hypothetical protein